MTTLSPLLGEDPAFLATVERASALARVDKPCLIVGERGTGKELFTSRLHFLSHRWEGPLVKINCAALSETLLESELFGHEAGSFTGATRRQIGRFERAEGGTLVMDEIAVASKAVQEKVLRIIEYGEFERIGGQDTLHTDVRIVGSTNMDLPLLTRTGKFRADLLDRLSFDVLTLPPLRARPGDILPLAHAFALDMTRAMDRPLFPGFTKAAETALLGHHWPGNIRELRNAIDRSVARAAAGTTPIDVIILDPFDSPWRPGASTKAAPQTEPGPEQPFADAVAAFEANLLGRALDACRHNQTDAAARLGLGYHQFRRLIKKHDLG